MPNIWTTFIRKIVTLTFQNCTIWSHCLQCESSGGGIIWAYNTHLLYIGVEVSSMMVGFTVEVPINLIQM